VPPPRANASRKWPDTNAYVPSRELACYHPHGKSVPLAERQKALKEVEVLRPGRTVVAFFNFDRQTIPSAVPGISTTFNSEFKEALFRVLKESVGTSGKVDLCLYTRGGDVNAVWPIVSLIREFDPDFEILVPFRCHSSGTILALGAKRIVMGPLSELSPIDPSTGNQFNPVDANKNRLAISVEDAQAYRSFVLEQLGEEKPTPQSLGAFTQLIGRLAAEVHPLALGNVHRVNQQIKTLAAALMKLHLVVGRNTDEVISVLATRFYSHLHMINRHEAAEILGEQVVSGDAKLSAAVDTLLRAYEEDFQLRKPFVLGAFMANDQEKTARFIGSAVESRAWSYLYETRLSVSQSSKLPQGVQLQIQPGQRIPLMPGLERLYNIEITGQAWVHNVTPRGVTL
jgi:hypothetical protein